MGGAESKNKGMKICPAYLDMFGYGQQRPKGVEFKVYFIQQRWHKFMRFLQKKSQKSDCGMDRPWFKLVEKKYVDLMDTNEVRFQHEIFFISKKTGKIASVSSILFWGKFLS